MQVNANDRNAGIKMSQNANNAIGGTIVVTSGANGVVGWAAQNATVLSLSMTLVSLLVGALFLFLNWSSTRRHQAQMREIAQQELDIKLAQATRGILSQRETQQDA